MIGRELLHYRILDRLGQGTTGHVYLAEDTRLRRRIALKLIEEIKDPKRFERFEKEAWALAALNHPNIVTIYSVERGTEFQFLTMELVEGHTLNELIVPGGIALEEFYDIATSLLQGLQAAHEKGIVHHDIKPQNIKRSREGRLKILDFGLATQPQSESEWSEETNSKRKNPSGKSNLIGTVPYMAPEILRGHPGDARIDIFSLGVLFYELLIGRRPFEGQSAMAVVTAILRNPTPELRDQRPDLSKDLERLLMRCLEKNPEARFTDAGDLLKHFQACEEWPANPATSQIESADLVVRKSSEASGSWTKASSKISQALPPQETFSWRHLGAFPILVSLTILVTFMLGVFLIPRGTDPTPSSASSLERFDPIAEESPKTMIVVLPFENRGEAEDSFFALGISDEITTRLSRVEGLGVISRASAARYSAEEKTAAEIGEELGVEFILNGSVRWDRNQELPRAIIRTQLTSTDDEIVVWTEEAELIPDDLFAAQAHLAEWAVERLGQDLLKPERPPPPTQSLEAYQAYLRGAQMQNSPRFDAAARAEAIRHFQQATQFDPSYAEAWAALATAHAFEIHLGIDISPARFRSAEEALEKARALQPEHPDVRIAAAQVQYRAFKDYDRALDELMFVRPAQTAEALTLYALIIRRQGRFEESLDALKRAETLDPRNAFLTSELASNCLLLRRDPCARAAFRRAIAIDPGILELYSVYVLHLWMQGDLPEARRYLSAMPETENEREQYYWVWQEIYEGNLAAARSRIESVQTPWFRTFYFAVPKELLKAQVLDLAGETEEASKAFLEAEQILLDELEKFPEHSMLTSSLGLARAGLGRYDEAILNGLSAVQQMPISRDAVYGPVRLIDLALIYTYAGEYDAARDQLDVLLSIPAPISEKLLEIDPRWIQLTQPPGGASVEP